MMLEVRPVTFTFASVLYIVAIILFILAAVGLPAGRYSLVAAGLAFEAAGHLIG